MSTTLPAQGNIDVDSYQLHIRKATGKIKLDGELDEPDWQTATKAERFFQQFPFDSAFAVDRTVARATFDDTYLYISAVCYDELDGEYIVASLKRDFSINNTDAFAVFIDPFNDKLNGFSFAVSPLGVQREGLVQDGGGFGVTTSWDNRWFSEVKRFGDRWQVEMAIPFKTLRYNQDQREWRINFARQDYKRNETSVWVPVPRTYNMATLAFTGLMVWEDEPPKAGANVSLIPYALGGYQADYTNGTSEPRANFGGDAKVAVSSSLNLDLTANPDFSQVEVDRQVTNLDRFSIFFPERRQFFIENSDLFSGFGFSRIRPFFSRQIGLKNGSPVPILGGARLSGKVNRNWRVGFMNIQEEGGFNGGLAENYTVGAFQRRIFGISNIAGIFVNRQSFNGLSPNWTDYNRIAGIDFNLFTKSNKWRGKVFYHQSFDNDPQPQEGAQAVWLMYNTPKLRIHYNHEYVGENYNAQTGFVPRTGYFRFEPNARYNFYPSNSIIQSHGPNAYASVYWQNSTGDLTDRQLRAGYDINFLNRSKLSASVEDWFLKLTFPFDPTRTGGTPLPEGNYRYRSAGLSYTSDFRKRFSFEAFTGYGTYFNGTRLNFGGEIRYRAQPWGNFALTIDRNQIVLPDPYATGNLWLISPRFEFSFSRSVFLTTFLQYNTQINNFSMNTRFQWRFKPMSDLFVVITENYGTENLNVRNRAVAVKLNYWFTL